jgi:AcrR family transcriptional regulator
MAASPDHRPRVAARRREAMRARLLDAGLATIVARGVAGTSIDEIISTAQVSRGTFYKYFDSVTGLAAHLAHDLAREIGLVLDPLVTEQPDPALRMAVGTRMMLHFVRQHPVIGGLIVKSGWPDVDESHLFFEVVRRDIASGIQLERFEPMPLDVAVSMVAGVLLGGMQAIVGGAAENYPEQATLRLLRALGVSAAEAAHLSATRLPRPVLPHEGIVARAIARAATPPDR